MTLVNPKPYIEQAQREGRAVGAFNANTLEQVQAIVLAAEATGLPAIVQVSHRALQYIGSGSEILGLRYFAEIGKIAAGSVSVPVALHLDHANEDEVVQAFALGFTSVMFDGSLLSYDDNLRTTRRLSKIARDSNVCMEAELGEVPKPGISESLEALTDPNEAVTFVAETGIDTLAVALGSVHSETTKHISLDLERLKAIRALVSVPLVLHGSSGVNDSDIAAGIRLGLSKINVATQLNVAFSNGARAALNGQTTDPRKYLGPAREAMQAVVAERLRFFNAAGDP
jgi:ketose-bisphosphate aldolase